MIKHNPHIQPTYRGIHYHYDNDIKRWSLYTNYYTGFLMMFNANSYRIDQCFDIFFKEMPK